MTNIVITRENGSDSGNAYRSLGVKQERKLSIELRPVTYSGFGAYTGADTTT